MRSKRQLIVLVLATLLTLLLGAIGGFFVARKAVQGASIENLAVGHKFLRDKNYLRSIAYFNRAVALDPQSFLASVSLADAYYAAGFFELAEEEYKTALELSRKTGTNSAEINYITDRLRQIQIREFEGAADSR